MYQLLKNWWNPCSTLSSLHWVPLSTIEFKWNLILRGLGTVCEPCVLLCLCSRVHRGASWCDCSERSGRGDGVLLQRGGDALVFTGDPVVVHQEPSGLDRQTAVDNQRSKFITGALTACWCKIINSYAISVFNVSLIYSFGDHSYQ